MSSSFPCLANSFWAVARSNPARVAPPMSRLLEPNLTSPETRNGAARFCASISIVSPTLMCFFPAVPWSITTSPDFGHAPPLSSVSELNFGYFGSTENPRCGAPPKLITFPFLPIRFVLESATPPIAAATSGSLRTSSSSDCLNGGRLLVEFLLTADLPVITASVFW